MRIRSITCFFDPRTRSTYSTLDHLGRMAQTARDLFQEDDPLGQVIWQAGLLGILALMIYLFGRPEIGLFLALLPLLAAITLGGVAGLGMELLEVKDAIALVRGAGGTATIAHPAVSKLDRYDLERLRAAGVDGLEVHHVDHDPGTRERLLRIAEALDMVPTAGSDYHGVTVAPDRRLGDVSMPAEDLARLEARRP